MLADWTDDEKFTNQMMKWLHGKMYRIDNYKYSHTVALKVNFIISKCTKNWLSWVGQSTRTRFQLKGRVPNPKPPNFKVVVEWKKRFLTPNVMYLWQTKWFNLYISLKTLKFWKLLISLYNLGSWPQKSPKIAQKRITQ